MSEKGKNFFGVTRKPSKQDGLLLWWKRNSLFREQTKAKRKTKKRAKLISDVRRIKFWLNFFRAKLFFSGASESHVVSEQK